MPMMQSLSESLTEALEEDVVPMSRSPSQAPESLPSETIPPPAQSRSSTPLEQRKATEETVTRVMTPDPIPAITAPDAKEDTRSVSSDTQIGHKGDRATIGDWVGTWWGKKPKGRPTAPFPSVETAADSVKAVDQESIRSTDTDEQSVGSSSTGADKKPRRKPTKSVFGTLGLSMLNPSLSNSFSSRKRRTISQLITPDEIAAATAGISTPTTDVLLRQVCPRSQRTASPSPCQKPRLLLSRLRSKVPP